MKQNQLVSILHKASRQAFYKLARFLLLTLVTGEHGSTMDYQIHPILTYCPIGRWCRDLANELSQIDTAIKGGAHE